MTQTSEQLQAKNAELTAEVERLKDQLEPKGTYSCPICGITTPHCHSEEEIALHRRGNLATDAIGYIDVMGRPTLDDEISLPKGTLLFNHESPEVSHLRREVERLKEENDTLRRIHKESIDILVKELSDKDYEYNQKTNRLIERHVEQLNRCDAEVKRLTGRKDGEVPNY